MAPPIPTLTPETFSAFLGPSQLAATETCPLKKLPQYGCFMTQTFPPPPRNSKQSKASPRARSKMVCEEFVRYFRRCADVGKGPNVEVTSLMGVSRPVPQSIASFEREFQTQVQSGAVSKSNATSVDQLADVDLGAGRTGRR